MKSIAQLLALGEKKLTQVGIGSARLDAELLLAHILGCDRPWLHAHATDTLPDKPANQFEQLITRRASRIPLVHLTGTREFYGLTLSVTPNVLTPRVETEQMVDWALQYAPENATLIDIGTGSGAIALAIAHHRPDLHITATDLDETQLEVAKKNFANHQLEAEFIAADLWKNVSGTFDVIVTNLPYLQDGADLMPEVTKEPAVALFGGPDGLSLYRRFLRDLPDHLAKDGYLFTECDPWQHEELIAQAAAVGLEPIEQGYFILGFRHTTQSRPPKQPVYAQAD